MCSLEDTDILFSKSAENVSNGAWTWFTDERVIVDTDTGLSGARILIGSVSAGNCSDGGNIDLFWYDVGSGDNGHFELHNEFEQDDHNAPSLFIRPDGRYLAMYAKHGNDSYTRWRVSTEPHDPTTWEPERRLDNEAGTTYCNTYRLPKDINGQSYCFTRTVNWDPNVLVSSDMGSTWTYGGRLLHHGEDDQRPYVKYASNDDRIHLITANDHPHQFNNSIYHGYIKNNRLFDSSGQVLNEDILNNNKLAPAPSDLTMVFEANTKIDGTRMTHTWPVDIDIDEAGQLVAVFQARADGDPADHRFFYAHYDGAQWQVRSIAKAGPPLYDEEEDYTGLVAIDPDTPTSIVISTPIDPRYDTALNQYELFAGSTTDNGASWEWTPLTPAATTDNLRPLIPEWNNDYTALVWMRGKYTTYTQWETQVVGRTTGDLSSK